MQTCEQCGKNEANIHVTQISPAGTVSAHLCEECARARGIAVSVAEAQPESAPAPAQPGSTKKCARCGITYATFREKGRVGCADCYDAFSEEIDALLTEVHGSCVHHGKLYSRVGRLKQPAHDIRRLRTDLARAVSEEEFEEAARIRDTINALVARKEQDR